MEVLVQMVLLAVDMVLLYIGARWLVDASVKMGTKYGIPQLAMGLTIVAMGTSVPEAMVSMASALGGNAEITVGSIVGSNILNILLVLGISAMVSALKIQKNTIFYEIPTMFCVTLMLLVFGVKGNNVGRFEGVLFLLIFIVYMAYLFLFAISDKKDKVLMEVEGVKAESHMSVNTKTWVLLFQIVMGLVMLVCASNLTVNVVTSLAKAMDISDHFLGFAIVALGTSLPELFTAVVAAQKGKDDIAVGCVIGSCIFNVLFLIGMVAVITPVVFMPAFTKDTLIAMAVCVLLFLFVIRKKVLTRKQGIFMLACYVIYLVYSLLS